MEVNVFYKPNPVVSCREECEDGALLFNADTGKLLVVNESALLVWKQIAEGWDLEKVMATFHDHFNNLPESEQLQSDIHNIIDSFINNEFIEQHDDVNEK